MIYSAYLQILLVSGLISVGGINEMEAFFGCAAQGTRLNELRSGGSVSVAKVDLLGM